MGKSDLKETLSHGIPAFPVAIYNHTFDKQYNLLAPLHYHDEFELLVATKGTVHVRIDENAYQLSQGEGVFINSDLLHSISCEEEQEHGFIAVVFDFKILCSEYETAFQKYIQPLINGTLTSAIFLPAPVCDMIQSISKAYETAEFGVELYIKSVLMQIMYLLVKGTKLTELPVQNAKSMLIKKVIQYMEEHYTEAVSLQDMAEYVHVSKEYLCRVFHTMSDNSPVEYLNRYRIRQSTSMLLHSGQSISQIALSCGFNHSSYYNKMFLRYMGCTPTEYRKQGK